MNRRTTLAPLLALAMAAGAGGCGAGSPSSTEIGTRSVTSTSRATTNRGGSPGAPGPIATGPSSGGCHRVASPRPRRDGHLATPHLKLDPARTYTVTVATNCGTFAFTLDVRDSPRTSASFAYLVRRGFFDGLTFHRVAAGFVIQGGDPVGNGSGGPGYSVTEPPATTTQYLRGDVAMAKSQNEPAGASGSQFFVVTAANATQSAGLTPDYALLGRVSTGMAVVERIGALPTNPPQDGTPTVPVVMSSVTLAES